MSNNNDHSTGNGSAEKVQVSAVFEKVQSALDNAIDSENTADLSHEEVLERLEQMQVDPEPARRAVSDLVKTYRNQHGL